MNTTIDIHVDTDEKGHFIIRAIGYPGVVTFGRSKEEAMGRIQEAWDAMAKFNAIKSNKNATASDRSSSEMNFQLQFA